MPWERTGPPAKILRIAMYPFTYHQLLERMNLLHYGVNSFTNAVLRNAEIAYPALKLWEVEIDTRED